MQRQPMDRVFPATRILGAVIFLALVPTVLLWVRPNDTSHWFAWTIHPSMTPLIMGAGYLCGAYFFARVVFARQWHHVGLGFLPIGVFATFMGIATFTHLDRFDDSHGAYLFLGGLALQLVGASALYLYMHRLARRMPDPATPVGAAAASPL
jgi:hypothetical protein